MPSANQLCFTPSCSLSSICIVVVVISRLRRSCPWGGGGGGGQEGGPLDRKLSRYGFETKCCGGLHHPPGSFIGSQSNGHGDTHGRAEFTQRTNYKMRDITTTYIIKHSVMRTLKPQNVLYQSTNPGTRAILKYKIIQWHDRWRPHASQWPKPTYHHSPLTESARPEHEPILKPELSNSQNPSRETKE